MTFPYFLECTKLKFSWFCIDCWIFIRSQVMMNRCNVNKFLKSVHKHLALPSSIISVTLGSRISQNTFTLYVYCEIPLFFIAIRLICTCLLTKFQYTTYILLSRFYIRVFFLYFPFVFSSSFPFWVFVEKHWF